MRISLALVLLALVRGSRARRYGRCELASILVRNGIPRSRIPDWICMATAESSLNSKAIHKNQDGSTDYGIFQINSAYWCSPGKLNMCNVPCSALRSDDIAPSIQCAKKIYRKRGFNAWVGWKHKCKGKDLSSYVKGCHY
ncbi:lysozyme C-like [Amblyomma americanum]